MRGIELKGKWEGERREEEGWRMRLIKKGKRMREED